MADYQPILITPGGDTIRTGFQKVSDNATRQLANWLDTAAPSAPVEGQHWGDSTNPANHVFSGRENGLNKKLLWFHRMEENLLGNGFQFVGLIPERVVTGSIVTPTGASEGTVQYDTTRKRLVYVTDTQVFEVIGQVIDSAYLRIPCRLTTAARTNAGAASVATEYGGYLLSAGANEITAIGLEEIPSGFGQVATANQKIIMELDVLLAQAESTNDVIGFTGTLYADSNQTAIGAKSASLPALTTSIGAATAIHTRHRVELTFGPGDFSSNPLAGDLLRASIALDTGQTVNQVILIGATIRVSSGSPTV